MNTVHGEVKILVCSYKAKFVCNRLNETKKIAKLNFRKGNLLCMIKRKLKR